MAPKKKKAKVQLKLYGIADEDQREREIIKVPGDGNCLAWALAAARSDGPIGNTFFKTCTPLPFQVVRDVMGM